MPRVYVDFQNTDLLGRPRLTCVGTKQDLARQNVELREGMVLTLYSDDLDDDGHPDPLEVEGVATYSKAEERWVAVIDWSAIRHASDMTSETPGKTSSP